MIRTFTALALFATTLPAGASSHPLERSISTSRQFIVYGSDAAMRGGICDLAERTKKSLLILLRERDEWKTPILVHAQSQRADQPDSPAARLKFSQTGFGLKLQLDLAIGHEMNVQTIARELLSAVLLEWMYRDKPDTATGTPYVQPPAWLLDGIMAIADRQNNSTKSNVVALAVAQKGVVPLADFVRQQPELLESLPREVYQAYAGALVSMLIDLPAGPVRLAKLINDLPQASNDPVSDLQAHFPETSGDPAALQERWAAAVERFAAKDRYRMLSCEETERELAALLVVQLRSGEGAEAYGLDQYAQLTLPPQRPDLFKGMAKSLLLLSARANPLYTPIIAEYQQIINRLSHRKTARIIERLARLRTAREEISRRMSAIDDYMNWYEATQSHALSGAFVDYMKAAELSAEREPRRRDAISVYLDTVEAQLAP